eukprot:g179.t1
MASLVKAAGSIAYQSVSLHSPFKGKSLCSEQVLWRPSSVHVTGHEVREDNVVLYKVEVEWGTNLKWSLKKRYSQFNLLYEKLVVHYPSLPKLPPKTWIPSVSPWHPKVEEDFVERRLRALDLWMDQIVDIPYVLNSEEWATFLKVDANTTALSAARKTSFPQEMAPPDIFDSPKLKGAVFSYNATVVRRDVILAACGDASGLSRLDKRITNWKAPWSASPFGKETKERSQLPLGAFVCYARQRGQWVNTKTMYFDCMVTALAHDLHRSYVFVGLENGHIVFYLAENGLATFTLIQDLVLHEGYVTGLTYSSQRDVLISTSRDKTLSVYCMKREKTICSYACDAWISSHAYDAELDQVWLGLYSRSLFLVQ